MSPAFLFARSANAPQRRDTPMTGMCGVQDTLTAFREEMDEELIPQAYGGLNTLPLDQSKPEIELRQLVQRLNQQ